MTEGRARSSRAGQARPRRLRVFERFRSWRRHHSHCAAESLTRVLQQPASSLMTWLVIGIAIALPAGLWVVLDNLSAVRGPLDAEPERLSLFLADAVNEADARALAQALAARADVDTVLFLSREEALAEFVERSGMDEIVDSLPENPLPHLLLLSPLPASADALAGLRDELAAEPAVAEVVYDTQWLRRLESLMALGQRATLLLALLLLAAVVLVLGNTIRLAIESRRDEIVISKLVGGSDAFVRRPLLYSGLWYGLGGGVVAALLVALGTALLRPAVARLAAAYDSGFTLQGLGVVDSLQLVLVGAFLGLLGAWLAVFRHLRDIEPR